MEVAAMDSSKGRVGLSSHVGCSGSKRSKTKYARSVGETNDMHRHPTSTEMQLGGVVILVPPVRLKNGSGL